MKNGEAVRQFEQAFARHVGARYAIALCNGTATLHVALHAIGVDRWEPVRVPPLTMSSTALAVLHAGSVPEWVDIDPATWLIQQIIPPCIPVALYGLHDPLWAGERVIVDAAQTLMPHGNVAFTSYSFQASKILSLGEGGMLVTNDEFLATRARAFSSLGYQMRPDQPRIDPAVLKRPDYVRHHILGWNYRMADLVAAEGLKQLATIRDRQLERLLAASLYRDAIDGVPWLIPQYVPQGWHHDYWAYPVAVRTRDAQALADAVVKHGGERPYAAWRLGYDEPALRPVDRPRCPVANLLQPSLLQFQTNTLQAAERNATALRKAIKELD